MPLPKIIAHRGASHAAPENTLAAFKLAWDEGADGIEGDFHLTRDSRIVCLHDADTRRTAGRKRVVAASNWADLKTLDVGSWKSPRFADQTIPLLEEVLAIVPAERYFFIEVKCGPEILGPLAGVLKGAKADPRRVIVISFNQEVVAACRLRLPGYQAHWISKLEGLGEEDGEASAARTLEGLRATGLQFKSNAKVRPEWIRQLGEGGLKTAAWVVDDSATARRMRAAGVDFLTTNRPAALRAMFP